MWCHHKNRQIIIVVLLVLTQCLGCVSIWDEPIENEIIILREEVLKTIREKIGMLSNSHTFCCKVITGWPSCDSSSLPVSLDYPYRLGVVGTDGTLIKTISSSSYDVALGEKILCSIPRCTVDDVVSVGMLRKREVRTAGLVWFGSDGSSFAGFAVLTKDGVYFIYTVMYYTQKGESSIYDIFWAEPPYYYWRNPYWALRLWKPISDHIGRMRKKVEKMYHDRESCSDFCFDNFVPAFRINISPDEFPKVQQN